MVTIWYEPFPLTFGHKSINVGKILNPFITWDIKPSKYTFSWPQWFDFDFTLHLNFMTFLHCNAKKSMFHI